MFTVQGWIKDGLLGLKFLGENRFPSRLFSLIVGEGDQLLSALLSRVVVAVHLNFLRTVS